MRYYIVISTVLLSMQIVWLNVQYWVILLWAVIFPVIVREFARWKVRNTAIERRDLIRNPVPLMPEFQRSVRLLGRRPTTQQFIDNIIKKYGTHILISATLGGKRGSLVSFAFFHAWLTVFTHCFEHFLHMICLHA